MEKIGFIGMGNMGSAILRGLLGHGFKPEELLFTDVRESRRREISSETEVEAVCSDKECAAASSCLVLAVKPQYYPEVLGEIRSVLKPGQMVISIAPGKSVGHLKEMLGEDKRIVRAMPNTPALLGEGMTGVCYDPAEFSREEEEFIGRFFASFGRMEVVEERLMDAVVCVSGSSPAYVYMMIEAMADGGVKYGLSRSQALTMAAQAVLGSAKMVLETGKHPGELKDMVCSPGGTTIAAVSALEEQGFRSALIKAADACIERCRAL